MIISIQNTIIKAQLALLRKITRANGLMTDIAAVKRGLRAEEDFQGDLPALSLGRHRNEREDSFQPGSESFLHFKIWGYVAVDPLVDDYENLDKLAADTEKILMDSTFNSEYYANTFIGDTYYFEGDSSMTTGIFEMNYRVSYFYKFNEV